MMLGFLNGHEAQHQPTAPVLHQKQRGQAEEDEEAA